MIVVLDTGVLGGLCAPQLDPALDTWMAGCVQRGRKFYIPEICDYELRRELVRRQALRPLALLDRLHVELEYLPITTSAMRRAADFWAMLRVSGLPTADDTALDADCILAAQAATLGERGSRPVVVATTNVGHLERMVPAKAWSEIS